MSDLPATTPVLDPGDGTGIPIVVRDLADGEPVAALEITLAIAGEPAGKPAQGGTRISDAAGVILVPGEGNWRAAIRGEGHRVLRQTADEVRKSGELWVYRLVRISGTVAAAAGAEQALDASTVALNILPSGDPAQRPDRRGAYQWDRSWLAQHGLGDKWSASRPDKTGAFSLEVPAVRGFVLQASASGWRPEWKEIPVARLDADPRVYDFRLNPAMPVRGIVRTADGLPLKDAYVAAYVIVRSSFEDVNPSRIRLAGHPVKMIGRVNEATMIYVADTHTDAEGRFELGIFVAGATTLTVHPAEGYRPIRLELPAGPRSFNDLDLVPAPAPARRRVSVVVDGYPVPGHSVSVSDLSVGDSQPTFLSVLDDDSSLAMDLLEEGHAYTVAVHPLQPPGRLAGIVVERRVEWALQEEIRLSGPGR